jgi:hypothetical protein
MIKVIDLIGQKFGRLTVIKKVENGKRGENRWLCKCSCFKKTEIITLGIRLKSGKTKSCGCLAKESISNVNRKIWKFKIINDKTYGVPLTKGKQAIIDKEDIAVVKDYGWCSEYRGYAVATINNKRVLMHRLIMNCPDNMEVDHINEDKLDNRKINLRVCLRKENVANIKRIKTNKTGYRGVSYNKKIRAYQSYIYINNKHVYLGKFKTIEEAAEAYKKASLEYHKEFSVYSKTRNNIN